MEIRPTLQAPPQVGHPERSRPGPGRRLVRGSAAFCVVGLLAAAVGQHLEQDTQNNRAHDRAIAQAATDDATARATLEARLGNLTPLINPHNPPNPASLAGLGLRSVKTTPGYGLTVSQADIARKQATTVEIGLQMKYGDPTIDPMCTGTKVSGDHGESYVLSAAHCFEDPQHPRDPKKIGPRAINRTDALPFKYTILDPELPPRARVTHPLAVVTSLAVDMSRQNDLALMKVEPSTEATRGWNTVPSLPLSSIITQSSDAAPQQGEQVSLYALPQASGFVPIPAAGIYLGRERIKDSPFVSTVDIVGIQPGAPSEDSCNFGSSGSSGMTSGGYVLSALAQRISLGYGPSHQLQTVGDKLEAKPEDSLQFLFDVERSNDIDASGFSVLCGFTAPTSADDIQFLIQAANSPNFVAS